jgi:H+/Na+-translocating ferredoxin:NAD+ oxidoreductase subunit G
MNERTREVLRIAWSMTAACALGAAILGAVFVATDRYQEAARRDGERQAIVDLLGLDASARVVAVSQYFAPETRTVHYRRAPADGARGIDLVFALDGTLEGRQAFDAGNAGDTRGLTPLGRLFVAMNGDRLVGFVIEGETRGYKNRIRFFVALDSVFDVAGVRVIEHEEDPGLGAEVATPWFDGQFVGRSAESLASLEVTRDPMPEDWRAALERIDRMNPAAWQTEYGALAERERREPIHAVSGATISSRALTDGVRATVGHFQRRWALLAPYMKEAS